MIWMIKNLKKRTKKNSLLLTGFILGSIITLILGFTYDIYICQRRGFEICQRRGFESREVRIFISEIIESVRQNSSFYRFNTFHDVEGELVKNKEHFGDYYTVRIYDYTFGTYEMLLMFKNGKAFYVEASKYKSKWKLSRFSEGQWPLPRPEKPVYNRD